MKNKPLLCFTLVMTASNAHAEFGSEFDANKAYVDGGLSFNTPDNARFDSATGFQLFAGYEVPVKLDHGLTISAEAGYKYKRNFEYNYSYNGNNYSTVSVSGDGLCFGGLGKYPIDEKLSALARLGYDFGDFNGLHIGGGAEYIIA